MRRHVFLNSTIMLCAAALCSCAASQTRTFQDEPHSLSVQTDPKEQWGIQILSLRRSAGGYMLDFRYRVLDPQKAQPILNRDLKPYLIDQATGAKFIVPSPPKVGPLRQSAQTPIAGRTYFVLFANPGQYVQPGNKVSVVIGDFKAENLMVE